MERLFHIFFNCLLIFEALHSGYGCTIDGVTNWLIPETENILDTFGGVIYNKKTSNIEGINSITFREGLNGGPYVLVSYSNDELTISTTDAYADYEENETTESLGFTVNFRCSGGSSRILVFVINIKDTNNNDPQFKPTNNYSFKIAPPVPPGFLITDCVNDIIVRDIDLTTERIDFEIEGSPLFEIAYDDSSSVPKEFKAILRTTTFIRSIAEPITLTISATDVDRTGDPRRTSTATVTITADTEFEFPDEPVFSQPFYLASYTTDSELLLQDSIYLHQGYDDHVKFSLDGQYSEYFQEEINGNRVAVTLKAPLPIELYKEGQIYLIIKAEREYTSGATATVIVQLPQEISLEFEQAAYTGTITDNILQVSDLILTQGYENAVINVEIISEHKSVFSADVQGNVITLKMAPLSADVINANNFINLQVTASTDTNNTATTVVTLEIIKNDVNTPVFERDVYSATYDPQSGLAIDPIVITQGYDETVIITLHGEHSSYFQKLQDGARITISGTIPPELYPKRNILLSVRAAKPRTVGAHTTVHIALPAGSLDDVAISLETILLNRGYDSDLTFNLTGALMSALVFSPEFAIYFTLNNIQNLVSIDVTGRLPESVVSDNHFVVLTLSAAATNAVTTSSGIVLKILKQDTVTPSTLSTLESSATLLLKYTIPPSMWGENPMLILVVRAIKPSNSLEARSTIIITYSKESETDDKTSFDQVLYYGKLIDGVFTHDEIKLSGFNGTDILMTGEYKDVFVTSAADGSVTVTIVGDLPRDVTSTALQLQANTARAVLLITVSNPDSENEDKASFDQVLYHGKLEDGVFSHDEIKLSGFSGTSILITGEYKDVFVASAADGTVTVRTIGDLPRDVTSTTLQLQANTARAVLLITVSNLDSENEDKASFDQVLYHGKLEDGVFSHDKIKLSGFSGTSILITGDYKDVFVASAADGTVTVKTIGDLPRDVTSTTLQLQANTARAVLLITVSNSDSENEDKASFDQVFYQGKLEDGVFSHDEIKLSGFSGTSILITGEYKDVFVASAADGTVTVRTIGDLPRDVTSTILQLQANTARAVLLITVSNSETPERPTVSFSSPSYLLWADISQTGVIGRVRATASNGETISYAIYTDDEYLQERIDINSEGEISLKSTTNNGAYNFDVIATAVNSQTRATAAALLRVDTLPQCPVDPSLPPLIILDRLEEEPHRNLVVLDRDVHKDCQYDLTNVWPADQSWLYVDEEGLHSRAVDREHESIAFMTVSQIQVELTLRCDSNKVSRAKRSLDSEKKSLYDYGNSKWILTDTIAYDGRKSLVNLIVEDINDNSPIFVGKENEPIYVGYPIPELENNILPRALVELKATDADIGENAAITYWSEETNLAVSPDSGSVHVRNEPLENNSRFTVYAIDQNGKGRNGTLDIVVKLLNRNQIAVLTVRDAFLDDEATVLSDLSKAIGYEIKVLKTVVIPETNEESTRRKREITTISGASLQLYVYGLLNTEPVDVTQLTSDINNSEVVTVNVARVLSLEDHLEGTEIGAVPGRDTGLVAATITLAVLLFIIIVAITLWFILKWRKKQNYDQFSDENSLTSRNESLEQLPKVEITSKPRLNIEELKRSERRLQEMLDTPVKEVETQPENVNDNDSTPPTRETVVNISAPEPQMPIVIQSIDKLKDNDTDDEDEFGETIVAPRKSVVTFNENVEKIIHLEDVDDDDDELEQDIEIYKF